MELDQTQDSDEQRPIISNSGEPAWNDATAELVKGAKKVSAATQKAGEEVQDYVQSVQSFLDNMKLMELNGKYYVPLDQLSNMELARLNLSNKPQAKNNALSNLVNKGKML